MPLIFPDVGIQGVEMRLRRSIAVAESPFSYDQQVYDFGGARWEAEVTLRPLSYADARAVEGFLIGLKGQSGTFTFGNPLHYINKSILTQSSSSIGDDTIAASGDSVDAGNYFQLGNYLYIVTENYNGSGDMSIQPPLREAIPTSTLLDFDKPTSTWRLTASDIGWSTGSSAMTSFTIPMVEAL
jgi:hypothetical protein